MGAILIGAAFQAEEEPALSEAEGDLERRPAASRSQAPWAHHSLLGYENFLRRFEFLAFRLIHFGIGELQGLQRVDDHR
jgi:hypothetical protein